MVVQCTNLWYILKNIYIYRVRTYHYNDVIMSAMASKITSVTIVYSTVCSGADSKKTSKLVLGLCEGDSPVTGEFPAQRASNAEAVSILWRHYIQHTNMVVAWPEDTITFKVLLQWKSTSVYNSWTYSSHHLQLALGTLMHYLISACLVCHTYWEKISINLYSKIHGSKQPRRFSATAALSRLQTNGARAVQRLWYCINFFGINRKRATGNSVIFMLLHWYCHRGFG